VLIGAARAGELIPEYDYADDLTAEDYQTPGSHPTDFENLLDIATVIASGLLYMHDGEPCAAYFTYPVLDCPTTIYVYKRVYTLSFACMCWDGNSGSWREWDTSGRSRRFGYFGGGVLETTDMGSGTGVHSSVHPYFDGFRSLGVGVLLALGGYELASV
jgi:hypothetical protein